MRKRIPTAPTNRIHQAKKVVMGKFEEFKNREFLGDKLLNLLVADILLDWGAGRNEVQRLIPKYTTNDFLARVYDDLRLPPHENDYSASDKKKGSAIEEHFWCLFTKQGYNETREAFERVLNRQIIRIKKKEDSQNQITGMAHKSFKTITEVIDYLSRTGRITKRMAMQQKGLLDMGGSVHAAVRRHYRVDGENERYLVID